MIKDIRLQKIETKSELALPSSAFYRGKQWDSGAKVRTETTTRPKTVDKVEDAELLLINCGIDCHTLPITPDLRDWLNAIQDLDLFYDGEADGKDIDWGRAPEEIRAYL
jgi:hypothetical protein